MTQLYSYYSKIDNTEYDSYCKNVISYLKTDYHMSDYDVLEYIHDHFPLYPLTNYKKIFEKYSTFAALESDWNKYRLYELSNHIFNYEMYPHLKDTYEKRLRDKMRSMNIPFESYPVIKKMNVLRNKLKSSFIPGGDIMGFHVNPYKLNKATEKPKASEIKFYINAGEDSYKFAYYFQKICEKNNLNYYYKVVNPEDNEEKRSDKICIYSTYEDAEKFLKIIKYIKENHPEFKYEKPSVLCGTIDDVIGVGQDYINNGSSYNYVMSEIVLDAIQTVFNDIPKEKILASVISETTPRRMAELIKEIKVNAEKNGLDVEKICLKKEAKDKLKKSNFGTL